MRNKEDNVLIVKSMDFAVRCVKLARYSRENYKEFELASQICRCGTSIGANAHEALRAQSTADFISKLSIAQKEASETQFWLDLLHRVECLSDKEYQSIFDDSDELCKLLMSIIKTTKNKKITTKTNQ